ncbi:MAG: pyridoxine 5'-phosphate synthase [Pseudomonadota bacterium]
MTTLGVNIDHVATLREARGTQYPSPLDAMFQAIDGGANQITIHLREDRRHIQDSDLFEIRKKTTVKLNLEMAPVDEIVQIAIKAKPDIVTLVPEKREEITTESGLDLTKNTEHLRNIISEIKRSGITVSLFIDPEPAQIEIAKEFNADAIELHTGNYAQATKDAVASELDKLANSAKLAKIYGLRVAAGHGLNYDNIQMIAEKISAIEEYNIGHAIVARSIFVGIKEAVAEMNRLIRGAS